MDVELMDLGTTFVLIAAAAALSSVVKGIVDWLRARRSTQVQITIEDKDGKRQEITLDSTNPTVTRKIIEEVLKR